MTYGHQNRAIHADRWRYIRYRDGTNEVYGHSNDPNIGTDLATRQEFRDIIRRPERASPDARSETHDGIRVGTPSATKQHEN